MDVHCGWRLKRPFVGGGKLLGKQPTLFLSPLKLPLSPHSGKRAGTALCWCCCFCLSTTRDFHVFRDINLAQTNDNRLNPWLCNGLNVLWSLSPWQLQARSRCYNRAWQLLKCIKYICFHYLNSPRMLPQLMPAVTAGRTQDFSRGTTGLTAGQSSAKNACRQCYSIMRNMQPQNIKETVFCFFFKLHFN